MGGGARCLVRSLTSDQSTHAEPEVMESEDPLFILYTSGSTGKPKGVQHSSAGYLLHAAMTHKYVFDYQEGDIYWCTADVGWITGHSYIVYGPLANGATTLMFEGVPTYPDASRCWRVIDKHQVNVFYTAPTALRQLMAQGDDFVNTSSGRHCTCWVVLANLLIRKHGSGITESLARAAVPLWTLGGRPRPAAS